MAVGDEAHERPPSLGGRHARAVDEHVIGRR
jgi:hypothetical protein